MREVSEGYGQPMSMLCLLQFINAKGVGDAVIRRLAEYCFYEHITPDDVVKMEPGDIASALALKQEIAHNIIGAYDIASRQTDELLEHNVSVSWLGDALYPERTKAILDKATPSVLFVRGNTSLFQEPSVGFCGSRKASSKGLAVTSSCARVLAEHGICVVSGYAHGVDMAAHRSAMENNGKTILVLAEGILRFREKQEIEGLFSADNHLVVSQFPPMLTWSGRNAMKRNGTIIGLSDAMILVESGMSGGTFAAGMETLERRHPLFVVDFAEPGPSAEANPHFIERGGKPIRGKGEDNPNLNDVVEATQQRKWKHKMDEGSLF